MLLNNLLQNIPKSNDEIFETILENRSIKIERIISSGQISDEDFWYDQEESEFVLVVQGEAIVQFEDKDVVLKVGDYLNISAHTKHRVKYTSTKEETIWLAIFYDGK